jgi:hypothetical protein
MEAGDDYGDRNPVALETARNDGRSEGDGPVMARRDDERIATTAREQAAFLRGFTYGCEQTINAHDDLVSVVTMLMRCVRVGARNLDVVDPQGEARVLDEDDVLVIADGRVHAAMTAVRRVREQGAAASLTLFECERAMGRR